MTNRFWAQRHVSGCRSTVLTTIVGALICLLAGCSRARPPQIDETTIVLRGQIRGLAVPPETIRLEVISPGGETAARLTPTSAGEFTARVKHAGRYRVTVNTVAYLSSTGRTCVVEKPNNWCEIVVPKTELRMAIVDDKGRPPTSPIQLEILGPVSPDTTESAGVVRVQEASGFSLVGVEFGTFTITARTPDGRTSKTPILASLSEKVPQVVGRLVLARRALSVTVSDGQDTPIEHAAMSTMRRTIAGHSGTFDLTSVPNGQQVQIRARGFMPMCQIVDDSDPATISLTALSKDRLQFTLHNVTAPTGLLASLPGSDCPVDIRGFRLMLDDAEYADQVTFTLVGAPPGTYSYRATRIAPSIPVRVPGRPVVYTIPPECLVCR